MVTDMNLSKFINILKQFTVQEFAEGQMDESLLDMGINSYNAIEIMIALEVEYDVEFPDSIISPELFLSPRSLYNGLMAAIDGKVGI